VLGFECRTVEAVHDPRLAVEHVDQRQVRAVVAVAVGEHELRTGVDAVEQRVQ
jgi:hypothetical protein